MPPRMRQTVIAALLLLAAAIVTWQRSSGPTPTHAPSITTAANEQAAPASAANDLSDLERSESMGGHTMRKHVGRSDADLDERLIREVNISAASTYTDKAAAQRVVSAAIAQNAARIDAWLASAAPGNTLALHYHGREVVVRALERGDAQASDRTSAIVVLRKADDGSYFVLTSYPESSAP